MAEKKKSSNKRDKCLDADRVLSRLKEAEEKIRELTEKILPMYSQLQDLTEKLIACDAKINSNENIFQRIKQRLGL